MNGDNTYLNVTLPKCRKEIRREIRRIHHYLKEIAKYFERKKQETKEEPEKWYKKVRNLGAKMAKIIIRSCCEVKRLMETDLPKDNLKQIRSNEIYSLNSQTNNITQEESNYEEENVEADFRGK
jgi:sugar-specific transcriptional regulator TrmB